MLSEFARTMVTDFPIQRILDHLVQRIVDVMPVTGAGVTLISPGLAPRYVAASNDAALRYEQLQTKIGQGPCLLAYETGEAVAVSDLSTDHRFPRFAPAAVASGLAATFTFPLRHSDGRLGALDLYRDTAGALDPRDLGAAQTLADVAAAYLLNAQAREEARVASDGFRRTSLHDSLTGLPNRVLLEQRLEHAALRARRSHTHAGVLFIDLDGFKQINDTHGHRVGDQLLCAVAHRLSSLIRPGDTLARLHGDEFVFLCEDMRRPSDVKALAVRVADSFADPFIVDGNELALEVTASIGLAFAGPGDEVSDQLIANADAAMYEAKRQRGATHHLIDIREPQQTNGPPPTLVQDLKDAFSNDRLELAYQPIVRTADQRIVGAEALLRWHDPARGSIPARTMIDVAERVGLITQIGAWVLERACNDHGRWPSPHPGALDLSVNVSVQQLMGPGFTSSVAAILDRTAMDPAALVLEMTEGIFIEDTDRAMSVLADLRTLGVRLALDDFGSGYSSLGYLRKFPVDIIKIDQGFIEDIGRELSGGAIIGAVTELAHTLGLSVTAEGIETIEQREAITSIGCENAQGFLYYPPMAQQKLTAELAALGA